MRDEVHEAKVREKEKAKRWVTDGARTRDNRSHNPVLYQLSYGHRDEKNEKNLGLGGAGRANMIGVSTEIKADPTSSSISPLRSPPWASRSCGQGLRSGASPTR